MEEIKNPDRDKNFEAKGSLPPLQEPAEELKAEERPNPPPRDDSRKECDRTDHGSKEQGTSSELILQMRKIMREGVAKSKKTTAEKRKEDAR